MDVSLRFLKNILEWKGDQIHLPKDENIFLLNSLEDSVFPGKKLNWVKKALQFNEKNLISFPAKRSFGPCKGVVVWLKEGECKEVQMNYTNSNRPEASYRRRNFFFLEKNSSLNWVECFFSSSFQSENYIFAEDFSVFNQLTINQGCSGSVVYCDLREKACFFSLDVNLSSLSKCVQIYGHKPQNISITRVLNFLKERDQSSWFIFNQHEGVSGYSRHWCRSILDGKSRNSVHSKVSIQAQESDSHQMIQDLILSPYAKTENKPELEVSKDQVKAAHGASTGTLNPAEIFYMNTRGLSKEKSLEFLITGWAEAVLTESDYDSFNQFLKKITPSLRPFLKKQIKYLLIPKN